MLVIPSEARDLGPCLRRRYRRARQIPRSLALLGMTTCGGNRRQSWWD